MKAKFKLNPNTILAICILSAALIVNLVIVIANSSPSDKAIINNYRETILPLNIFDFVKVAIILLMAWLVFFILKKVLRREKWNSKYHVAIKRIGWLSILVMLMDAISTIAREKYTYKNESLGDIFSNSGIFTEIISQTVFSSPVAWLLICCIFILADVVQYAGELKSDNQSII